MDKIINRVTLFVVVACVAIILYFLLKLRKIERESGQNTDKLIQMYLKHSKKNAITDTIKVYQRYILPQIPVKVVEKPVVVKEYIRDTVLRHTIEKNTLIAGQNFKLNLTGKLRTFSVAAVDTAGNVRESFYKVPILTKEIKITPAGEVEFKKRKLIALKIGAGIVAGAITYSYIRKKI